MIAKPGMRRTSNAFETITKHGNKVYRIYIDTNEILSWLEQGKTKIALDILSNNVYSKTGKNGKPYRCMHYTTWAIEPTNTNTDVNTAIPQQASV